MSHTREDEERLFKKIEENSKRLSDEKFNLLMKKLDERGVNKIMNDEQMTPEQTARAEIINDRLNALSIDVKGNLETASQIGNIMLGPELQSEKQSEEKAKSAGWFSNVIDMLIFINNNNHKLAKELVRIRKEFKK